MAFDRQWRYEFGSPNRIFVYGMQSSGASYVAWALSQGDETIGILDVFNHHPAPRAAELPADKLVVCKATVSLRHNVRDHLMRFRPGSVIFVKRDADAILASLRKKSRYGKRPGEKLVVWGADLVTSCLWDEVVVFEEFVQKPISFTRSLAQVVSYNLEHCEWCRKNYGRRGRRKWGTGGVREDLVPVERRLWDTPAEGVRSEKEV